MLELQLRCVDRCAF